MDKFPTFENPLLSGLEKIEPYEFSTPATLHDLEPPPMIIDDVLPAGGIMGITSSPGIGKSWLTMEVVKAVCSDSPFLGHFSTLPGSALFVGSDSSQYDYARQWTRLTAEAEREHSIYASEIPDHSRAARLVDEYGPDYSIGPFHAARFLLQSGFMLDNLDDVRRLIRTCLSFEYGPEEDIGDELGNYEGKSRRFGFRVIIFDTLSKLTHADQNDNTQMEQVFRMIRLIAEATGAAVIILHHNGKRGEDWRGAISQIGALDSWIQLSNSKANKYKIKVTYKKFRGITPTDFNYQMNVSDEKSASLVFLPEETTIAKTELQEDILATFMGDPEKVFTLSIITGQLANKWSDKFSGNMKNLRSAILSCLNTLTTESDPAYTIRSQGGGKGKTRYFWLTKSKETSSAQAEPETSGEDD